MFVKIKQATDLRRTLLYNEQKVTEGKATLLLADNFLKQTANLALNDKTHRLELRNSTNERIRKPTTHFSVNFDSSEQLSDEKMSLIARRYMQDIGYGEQPYLVYRHHDAGHPHFHVVSSIVRFDGTRIYHAHPRSPLFLAPIRKIEQDFSLATPHSPTPEEQASYQVKQAQRVVYGQGSKLRAVSDVLNTVIDHYNYTSMDELNAILKQYNVRADPGKEITKMHQNRGLVYEVLTPEGRQISRGIKASSFALKPTLPYLEKKFGQNQASRQRHMQRVMTNIDWAFYNNKLDWPGFEQAMRREGIAVIVQEEKKDRPADIYFVDHREKSSILGKSLGSGYTLQAIRERCVETEQLQQELAQRHHLKLRM